MSSPDIAEPNASGMDAFENQSRHVIDNILSFWNESFFRNGRTKSEQLQDNNSIPFSGNAHEHGPKGANGGDTEATKEMLGERPRNICKTTKK